MAEKELRFVDRIELRDAGENSRHVSGYALVFNSLSNDLGFREIILPEAIEGVIEKSDVLCLLNHNQERGVLARSTAGTGSLKLTVDEIGLKYEFDAPKTALGDELLEGLRRGDIRNSSFGFTVAEDEWQNTEDGELLRTIKRFDELFDVSPVYFPAYSQTTVEARNKVTEYRAKQNQSLYKSEDIEIDMLTDEQKEMWMRFQEFLKSETRSDSTDEEKEKEEEEEKEPETNSGDCEKDEKRTDEDTEKKEEETEKASEEDQKSDEDEDTKDESEEEEKEEKSDEKRSDDEIVKEERKFNINIVQNTMTKEKFSLIKTLNDMVEGRSFDDATCKLNEQGVKEFRKSNIGIGKNSLSIPMIEKRDAFLAGGNAKDVIPTDTLGLVPMLKDRLILAQAGAHILSGLSGNNIEIPYYTGCKPAQWKSEFAKADSVENEFKVKKLTPKRLTASLVYSRQFLLQTDSIGAEEVIKKDLIDTLAVELERTILGKEAGTDNQPAGLFYNVTEDSSNFTFSDSILMETELEHGNVYSNNICYLANPSAKAILRSTPKDTANGASGQYIMEGGEVNGIPVYSSNVVCEKGLLLCDPSELWISIFSGLNITVDTASLADQDAIRIVANMYVDAITRRDEAFVKRILA